MPLRSLLLSLSFAIALLAPASQHSRAQPAQNSQSSTTSGNNPDVVIRRDSFGVPHVLGATDAAAAYGLAWAHAEDDFATIQDVLLATRGRLGERSGIRGAGSDYAFQLLEVRQTIETRYLEDLSPETRALVEAYAAGLNRYAEMHPQEVVAKRLFPVTGQDITSGFAFTSPFFFGLDRVIAALNANERLPREAGSLVERGSNAFAVAPSRSGDGSTILLLNSHQPWSGPVAWYEAHVTSAEGLNFSGAVFPGSPIPLNGHNGNLGWANTINHPDLIDVYRLELDRTGRRYRLDGRWLELESRRIWLKVRFGPLVVPVPRMIHRSLHGPVIKNRSGAFALRYAGFDEIRQVEQYYRLARANDFEEWLEAMRMQAISSTNFLYADKTGRIGMFYNARMPRSEAVVDWSTVVPGDRSDLIWSETIPFDGAPHTISPRAGFLFNANNTPFLATSPADDLPQRSFSELDRIETEVTNRALRAQRLMTAEPALNARTLWQIKMDTGYERDSPLGRFVQQVMTTDLTNHPDLAPAQALLRRWDWNLDGLGPADTLAALVLKVGNRALYRRQALPDPISALEGAVKFLRGAKSPLDRPLRETLRLRRGDVDLPLIGGPDALRAIGWEAEGRDLVADFGDGFIMEVIWDESGKVSARSVHQFGTATSRRNSPHYADQTRLFSDGKLKPAWFSEADIAAHTARKYSPP